MLRRKQDTGCVYRTGDIVRIRKLAHSAYWMGLHFSSVFYFLGQLEPQGSFLIRAISELYAHVTN